MIKNETFPFLEYIGAKLIYAENGKSQIKLSIQNHHLQHIGLIHGGVISTLIDNTGWYAAQSNVNKKSTVVTMEMKINYLKASLDKNIIVNAEIKSQGRTTSFVVVEVIDDQDKLLAYGTCTYSIIFV